MPDDILHYPLQQPRVLDAMLSDESICELLDSVGRWTWAACVVSILVGDVQARYGGSMCTEVGGEWYR